MELTRLQGKLVITGKIRTLSGLRIGGNVGSLRVGGLDLPIARDSRDLPYIPGSSLKGKLRTLADQFTQRPMEVGRHLCRSAEEFDRCPVCPVWGVQADERIGSFTVTRLIVRDAPLSEASRKALGHNVTELKAETAINRMIGASAKASFRVVERVPAGAEFEMALLYSIFDLERDTGDRLGILIRSLALLEDDYLGAMGSRGYGWVEIRDLALRWNRAEDYEKGTLPGREIEGIGTRPVELVKNIDALRKELRGP